jgi:hypothetical protein
MISKYEKKSIEIIIFVCKSKPPPRNLFGNGREIKINLSIVT